MSAAVRRFNVPTETWDAAVDEVYDLLAEVARRSETISYGAVVARMSTISLAPDSTAFHHLLGDVSKRAFDEGAPLLSAVVVHKDDGKPGGGFARLGRRLGFEVPAEPAAEDVFWGQQLTAVHGWWGRRRPADEARSEVEDTIARGPARTKVVKAGGCREAVLNAFVRLEARDGRTTFSAGEVVEEVRRVTSAFKTTTIQTYVVSAMCADAPVHHANHTDDLRRVGRGRYRRAVAWRESPAPTPTSRPSQEPKPSPLASTASASNRLVRSSGVDRHSHWAWEGNVQAVVAAALAQAGWQLRSLADTASRAQGVDIVADRAGQRLRVEVKGYPAGSTSANTQARHHFGDALLAGVLMAEGDDEASCVLAFPAFTTYTNLVTRSRTALEKLGIGVLLVGEDGVVVETVDPAGGLVLASPDGRVGSSVGPPGGP